MPSDSTARLAVLVNGLPAAGKSTLAAPLARALALPLFSKDTIKETHADVLGSDPPDHRPQRDWNRALGQAAGETMWALLAQAPAGAVLESSWRADVRDLVVLGLAKAGISHMVEVWCEVPSPLARRRDQERWPSRHAVHGARMLEEEWARMRDHARPLALGPVIRVDTTEPVDVDALAERIGALSRP